MCQVGEYFRSVGDVWAIWCLSVVALSLLVRKAVMRARWPRWRRLVTDEGGATYTLALAIVLPFYVVLLATVIVSTQIILVKLGTVYAAYAAARAAIVWGPANPEIAYQKCQLAAVQALTPFAANHPLYLAPNGGAAFTDPVGHEDYYRAYSHYAENGAPFDYLARKREYAIRATTILTPQNLGVRGETIDEDFAVTVQYEMPLDVPAVGRLLGHVAPWPLARFYTRTVTSTVTLAKEGICSDNPNRLKLGIVYDSTN